MKTIRIVTVAVLMVASAWALHELWAPQAVNTPANENREEQSHMTNEKVIMLIQAKNSAAAPRGACRGRTAIPAVGCGRSRAWKRFTSRHEKTIPIHLFSTRFTGRKQHRISICNGTSLRNSWRR